MSDTMAASEISQGQPSSDPVKETESIIPVPAGIAMGTQSIPVKGAMRDTFESITPLTYTSR